MSECIAESLSGPFRVSECVAESLSSRFGALIRAFEKENGGKRRVDTAFSRVKSMRGVADTARASVFCNQRGADRAFQSANSI